eukprot:9663451-Ditylum_brightwellii.AAC.1
MSFGWKISTLEGETIVEHVGPAFGQASSFQAEGYGVLSVMSFFRRANGVHGNNNGIKRPTVSRQ